MYTEEGQFFFFSLYCRSCLYIKFKAFLIRFQSEIPVERMIGFPKVP